MASANSDPGILLQDQQKSSCIYTLKRSQNLGPVINILALITWMFAMAGTFHCSFIMIEQLVESAPTTNATDIVDHPVGLGLFSTSVYDMDSNLLGCVSYYGTSDEFDGAFRAARTFGMIAALCTSVALICVTLVTLFVESVKHKVNLWSAARFLFFASFLCELLTFLAFGRDLCSRDDMECSTGPASVLTVLNLILLLFLSALIYVVPPVLTPLFLLRKERPLAEIDIADQEECSAAKFEILSIQRSDKSATKQKKQQQPSKGPVDLDELGSDLESECGTGTQAPSMIMEGIECVAADHLKRDTRKRSQWEKLVDKYYAIGRKKRTRITAAVLISTSWIFTIVAITRCTFILVGATGQERNEFSGLGLFNRAYYMNDDILGCIAYPWAAKDEFDGAFKVGRAFGMITLLLMTVAFASFFVLHGFVESSRKKELAWWSLTQVTLPCAFVSQLITFSAFETQSCTQSDNVDCVPGVGAIFAILNVFVLLPLVAFIFALPCPERSFFRMRTTSQPRLPPASKIRAQVRQFKESLKQKKKQQKKETRRENRDEGHYLPEPTSTHSVSDHSLDGDHGVHVRQFAPDPPGAGDEGIEMCKSTFVRREKDGRRTITLHILNPDGSTSLTSTAEQLEPNVPSSSGGSSGPSCTTSQGVTTSEGPTYTSMEPPTTSEYPESTSAPTITQTSEYPESTSAPTITQTSSWDSRASVEQFETVDMDTNPPSVIEQDVRAATKRNTTKAVDSARDVQVTAMAILKEMQEEEERRRPQATQQYSKLKNLKISVLDDVPNRGNRKQKSSNSSQRTGVTTRGGRVGPGTTTSSDAVGGYATSNIDTCSKIASTDYDYGGSEEDDGITFNTGDAIDNDDRVVDVQPTTTTTAPKMFI